MGGAMRAPQIVKTNVETASNGLQLWFTAQEIADFAAAGVMAGMPTDKSNVWRLAEREGWENFPKLIKRETGIGGVITRYHLELLPAHVRLAYLVAMVPSCGVSDHGAASDPPPQTDRARMVAMAKLYLIEEADRMRGVLLMGAVQADGLFCEMVRTGKYRVPEWVQKTVDKFSARTLARWRERAKGQGILFWGIIRPNHAAARGCWRLPTMAR